MRNFVFAILLLPSLAFAHATGQSYETRVGAMLLDVGCTEQYFTENHDVFCSIGLIANPDSGDAVLKLADYDTVTVKLVSATSPSVFERSVAAEKDVLTFVPVKLPRAGTYVLNASVELKGRTIAAMQQTVTVRSAQEAVSAQWRAAIAFIVLLIAGASAVVAVAVKKQ